MENIHELDENMVESLMNMFNSEDEESIKMGLTILNNADFENPKIVEYINEIHNKIGRAHV